MTSWANKSKQAPNLVPIVTTTRGESETVLALSSRQDPGPLMQKAFLFFFVCGVVVFLSVFFFFLFFPSFKEEQEQKIQFQKGCYLSYKHVSQQEDKSGVTNTGK